MAVSRHGGGRCTRAARQARVAGRAVRLPRLPGAGAARARLCGSCRARLVPLRDPRCGRCGAPAVTAIARCPECRGRALAFRDGLGARSPTRRWRGGSWGRSSCAARRRRRRSWAPRSPRARRPGCSPARSCPSPRIPPGSARTGMNQAAWLAGALGRAAGSAGHRGARAVAIEHAAGRPREAPAAPERARLRQAAARARGRPAGARRRRLHDRCDARRVRPRAAGGREDGGGRDHVRACAPIGDGRG